MTHPPRFFVPQDMLRLGAVVLPPAEALHAAKALRLRPGAGIEISDGAGRIGAARLVEVCGKKATAVVEEIRPFPEPRPRLVLATAIPKGKRWQWLVEKCTELGVACLQPLRFQRSVAQGEGGRAKWERWAIEAAKQSRRVYLPRICAPQPLADFLASRGGSVFLAAIGGSPAVGYAGRLEADEEISVIVGPEGDLTDDERRACSAAGALPLCLGRHVMRVETAAVAACAIALAAMAWRRERA